MISILLNVTIPIAYVAIGSFVGLKLWDRRIDKTCIRAREYALSYDGDPRFTPTGNHDSMCDCQPAAAIGGLFWPATLIFILVYVLMNGRAPKSTRLGRAQRRAQKHAKRIMSLEKELGL